MDARQTLQYRDAGPSDADGSEREGSAPDPGVEHRAADGEAASCSTVIHGNGNKEELPLKFLNIIGRNILCLPELPQKTTHFSDLPPEIFLGILKLVASQETDEYEMLDVCAAVCRGWYAYARDPIICRQACLKLWTENERKLNNYGGSWQRMYLERPNVLTFGCYIASIFDSKNSSSHRFYYLKFFSDGRVVRKITKNQPNDMLGKFKRLKRIPHNIPFGHYVFKDQKLVLSFNVKERKNSNHFFLNSFANLPSSGSPISENLEFEIPEHSSRRLRKLSILKVATIWPKNVSVFLPGFCLPPFIYSS